jgi:hypothetical protein
VSSADDLQRAAGIVARSDTHHLPDMDKVYDALIADGWTPPGSPGAPGPYHRGYEEGFLACHEHNAQVALTTSPDDWTPVELRWRHVWPGDSIVGEDGKLWHVVNVVNNLASWDAFVVHGTEDYMAPVDPDETVSVLCPAVEANALARVREELGGSVIDRTV